MQVLPCCEEPSRYVNHSHLSLSRYVNQPSRYVNHSHLSLSLRCDHHNYDEIFGAYCLSVCPLSYYYSVFHQLKPRSDMQLVAMQLARCDFLLLKQATCCVDKLLILSRHATYCLFGRVVLFGQQVAQSGTCSTLRNLSPGATSCRSNRQLVASTSCSFCPDMQLVAGNQSTANCMSGRSLRQSYRFRVGLSGFLQYQETSLFFLEIQPIATTFLPLH